MSCRFECVLLGESQVVERKMKDGLSHMFKYTISCAVVLALIEMVSIYRG